LPTGKSEPIGENNIVASFKFEDGSIGNLTYCTVGSDSSAGELVEFYAPGIGASSEDFKQLVVKKGSTRKKQSKVWAAKGYEAQLQSFVRCLREGREPEITVLDGAKAFLGCLLMLESARNDGSPQTFDIERVLPD
jgi:predicted dehydrogenase